MVVQGQQRYVLKSKAHRQTDNELAFLRHAMKSDLWRSNWLRVVDEDYSKVVLAPYGKPIFSVRELSCANATLFDCAFVCVSAHYSRRVAQNRCVTT